ncbi:MAG: sulfide/dihydroorotate dehydrogenase-like FAD/NAD-binding protein [Clostridia bacterium]|nr:sulfide/dihydroorotate dehydrogenase-like FAD/NAD-binding protein [Clostridia bacterium]
MYPILKAEQLCESVFRFRIRAERVAKKVRAGQFVILRVNEYGERIPFTVSDYNRDSGEIEIIFQAVGESTMKLSLLKEGDCISDVVGPLGVPTEYGNAETICVIGGGLGCAIALPQAKTLFCAGKTVDIIAGFRSRDLIILEDEMAKYSRHLTVLTDDGSNGRQGLVTDGLKRLCESNTYDLVIAIGPPIMMKFVCQLTKELNIPTIVSLNPIMIDGTGMCGGCRVKVGGETKFACVDGPDFDGHLVDFDELIHRNRTYSDIEKSRKEAHLCRIGLH